MLMILCSVVIVIFRESAIIAKETRFPPIGKRLVAISVCLFFCTLYSGGRCWFKWEDVLVQEA